MPTSYLLANNFLVETALSLDFPSLRALEQAFLQVEKRLQSFASDPQLSQKLAGQSSLKRSPSERFGSQKF
jgi:hypothetical protein